mmetsp:Transcript_5537/g.7275  ORF Transcript_5537/g.7275 Transcript_5537/m.7275 type:complete len:488 (-) Transcript_5537:180-1643(-)
MWGWIFTSSLVAILAALFAQKYDPSSSTTKNDNNNNNEDTATTTTPTASSDPAKRTSSSSSLSSPKAVYVIGDLHGDVHCAKHWVQRTGLIIEEKDEEETTDTTTTHDNNNNKKKNKNNNKFKWIGNENSHLVFVGDYVDKGPTSRQTIEFVKALTDQFPKQVTALMGNHEMELLLDRDEKRHSVWGGAAYFQMAWSSVHPGEYLNYLHDNDDHDQNSNNIEEDSMIIDALYNASIEVYGYEQERNVVFKTKAETTDSEDNIRGSILDFVSPMSLRPLIEKRMPIYQQLYLSAFSTGTELGTWLEQRPVLALIDGTLFVHGGISSEAAQQINQIDDNNDDNNNNAHAGIDALNQALRLHASESQLYDFIENTMQGRAVYDMLTYRGNHQKGACSYLKHLLPDGVHRLAVGHTPSDSVRILCQGQFLALDSALGRWFRNSGNDYCPGHTEQVSSNGNYRCYKMDDTCQGQIVKIQHQNANGKQVELIY